MHAGERCKSVVKFVADEAPKLKQYAIENREGETLHVYDANIIRLLSEGLGVEYDVTMPPDGAFGKLLPDGNWTGMVGMVQRSEVDIAVDSVTLTEQRRDAVDFAFPHVVTEITFMTDKPALSRQSSVLSPYSHEVWMVLLASVVTLSVLLHILTNSRRTYGCTLFRLFGSLVEQSVQILTKTSGPKLLVLAWVVGAMIVSLSYKAVLLSFLSVPDRIGIRNFADLSRAAVQNSIACYTYRGSYLPALLDETGDDVLKAVGECLKNNQDFPGDAEAAFLVGSPKKAFITGRVFMIQYEREYFISEDSIFTDLHAFPYSKTFTCPNRLNMLVHRLLQAGLIAKIQRDESFTLQLLRTSKKESDMNQESEFSSKISLEEISDAFRILISGWILSSAALLVEMVLKKKDFQKRS